MVFPPGNTEAENRVLAADLAALPFAGALASEDVFRALVKAGKVWRLKPKVSMLQSVSPDLWSDEDLCAKVMLTHDVVNRVDGSVDEHVRQLLAGRRLHLRALVEALRLEVEGQVAAALRLRARADVDVDHARALLLGGGSVVGDDERDLRCGSSSCKYSAEVRSLRRR